MKNPYPGKQYTRRPSGPERTIANRLRLGRAWSVRGCILDLWRVLGARRPPLRKVRIIRRFREISLDDWALPCDLCGEGTRPRENPHRACIDFEAAVADLRPAFGGTTA